MFYDEHLASFLKRNAQLVLFVVWSHKLTPIEQKGDPGKSKFKGSVVFADIGKDGDQKVVLDAGLDGMFLLFAPKPADLLPRIKAALVLACMCQMYVDLFPFCSSFSLGCCRRPDRHFDFKIRCKRKKGHMHMSHSFPGKSVLIITKIGPF